MATDFEYPWQFTGRRSATMAHGGMVATSQPLAARAGLRILEDGGTAADAAVATAAVLNVVEPNMTGIGGDMFALTQFDERYEALNGSGGAPAAADIETYRDRTDATTADGTPAMPVEGGMPVTVPGALDGWQRLLDRYGRLDLATVLEPAIEYAREGFPVSEYIAWQWQNAVDRLSQYEESARTFLINGDAPDPGQTVTNPTIAETFETIGAEGIEAFYGGPIGEAVVETAREHGGTLTLDDLTSHTGEWTEPISTTYHGMEVLEHPPNGQGAIALTALNIAEQFDLPDDPTHPDRLHHLIEATKLGFADGTEYITDPAMAEIPLETMLSKDYAAERAASIGSRAGTYAPGASAYGNDTIYLTVVDEDGNAVSLINSVYANFGSGLTAAGFALQNRGHSFSLDPDHNNALEPGKRPYHTIIPAMLREDDTFRAAWGVMGGSMQPQGHLQVVGNLVDADLNPQAAMDVPRFRWLDGRRVAIETSRMPESVVATLRGYGHRIVAEEEYYGNLGHFGGGQMIYIDDDGVRIGGSDPRKDGLAIGY
ncbi:MAG: gamma-glutamyltransferase [Halobacteriales archaeon]|nr:gamma-glutamyltransferase [Halobacteriales archaeon]